MTGETQHFEKKSLRKVTGASADWHGLAESCVAFATAHGGLLRVGIEDGADTPPKGQVIPSDLPSTIAQRIGQLTVNVTVDAVIREGPAGTIHRLEHQEILTVPQRSGTAHTLSLPECLRWLRLAYPEMEPVEFRFWGIEPQSLEAGAPLTPSVQAAAKVVANEIRQELERLAPR